LQTNVGIVLQTIPPLFPHSTQFSICYLIFEVIISIADAAALNKLGVNNIYLRLHINKLKRFKLPAVFLELCAVLIEIWVPFYI
jgi:hypothetical protein